MSPNATVAQQNHGEGRGGAYGTQVRGEVYLWASPSD